MVSSVLPVLEDSILSKYPLLTGPALSQLDQLGPAPMGGGGGGGGALEYNPLSACQVYTSTDLGAS